jgi:prevent-host-death family protein
MKNVTATEARKHLFDLIEQAGRPGSYVTITHEGIPKVIVMSTEDFEGWQETVEIMADPDLLAAIKEGMDDMRCGRVVPLSALRKKDPRKRTKRA